MVVSALAKVFWRPEVCFHQHSGTTNTIMSAECAPPPIAVAQKEGDAQAPLLHSINAPALDEDEEEFINKQLV